MLKYNSTGSALECYVCANQTDNSHKCLNTIKTCEPGEDVCLSEIRWGSTPYFSMGAQKQFYVSKRCAQKKVCQRIRSKYMNYCTHIWYEDWACSECCLGDRCNYYIIVSVISGYNIIIFEIYDTIYLYFRVVLTLFQREQFHYQQ